MVTERSPRVTRVAVVCTGNICRSPIAEVVLRHLVDNDERLRTSVEVSSAGTARWHVGDAMDPRARAALDRAGLTGPGSPAAYADADYLDAHDVVIVMTREHRDDVAARLTRPDVEVVLLRDLVGEFDRDLADPYYGDDADFDECVAAIRSACQRWTEGFRRPPGEDGSEV